MWLHARCRCFSNPILMIQQHGQHPAASLFLPTLALRVSAFLSSCMSRSGLFFPASSEVFKTSVLSPSHASLAAISTSTSSRVSRAVHHPSPVRAVRASLPSNQTCVKPLSVVYNATAPFPPRQSTSSSVYLPTYLLPLSLRPTSQPADPTSADMPPQRPTHTRLHVQNTFDALKVLVSRPRPILPNSHPHSHFYPQEAVRIGALPLVTRRLTDQERSYWIRSGSIFVWKESDDDTGIKRWTDGICWSQSRMREPFLFYEEKQTDDRRVTNPKITIPCDAYVLAIPFTGMFPTLASGAAPPSSVRASLHAQIPPSTCHMPTLRVHCHRSSRRRRTVLPLSSKRTPPGSPIPRPIRGASTI